MFLTFPRLPPEINSTLMFAGAGAGSLLSAAAAWEGLAAELSGAAASFGSVVSGLYRAFDLLRVPDGGRGSIRSWPRRLPG